MSRRKKGVEGYLPFYCLFVYWYFYAPDVPLAVDAAVAIMWGLVMGLGIRSHIKGDPVDPEVEAQRQTELRQQRIAELEADLGYEPLNLHELHDIVKEHHERKD